MRPLARKLNSHESRIGFEHWRLLAIHRRRPTRRVGKREERQRLRIVVEMGCSFDAIDAQLQRIQRVRTQRVYFGDNWSHRLTVDTELVGARNLCAGACEADHHYINVNYGRDYKADIVTDLKLLQAGDPCPVCGQPVKSARGIEVGQVFKLGTKYSEAMHLYFKDENQQEHPVIMGCYGIGVTRTLAAVVEQYHDDNGIIWPMSVAPYHAVITVINPKDEVQMSLAGSISARLEAAGLEVVIDERDERPLPDTHNRRQEGRGRHSGVQAPQGRGQHRPYCR